MRDLIGPRFPGLDAGYESFYLCAREPGGARAVWIRYTAHKSPGVDVTGSVWCTLFEHGRVRAVKETAAEPTCGDAWLRLGASSIAEGTARAVLAGAGWDIDFDGDPPFAHLPLGMLYSTGVPKTKAVSVHPRATFSGSLSFGADTIDLSGWEGMVGHNWGTQHAERWIWIHGLVDNGWLDVILARIRVAGRTTPWIAMGGLSADGAITRIGRGLPGRRVVVREQPDRCEFEFPGGIRGNVSGASADFVGWTYADPDGSTHDVVNCSIAELAVTLAGRERSGPATYELGMREHSHGVPMQPFIDA